MAGVLQFTLGLEASKFLGQLGMASGGVLSLAGLMQGLGKIVSGTWDAIERGGALVDLHNRTRESVRDLYQLQEGFKVVGLGADNVAPMVLKLQKALSGVDETGEKTDAIFTALGLDMERIKRMDAPKQFEALARAMASLPKEQASGIASKIFGREGPGNILQLARDMQGFQQSLRDSAQSANVFARTARAFDEIGDTITTIKMKAGGMFAGLAEGAAPAIQQFLDRMNRLDWVGFGQRLGNEITIAFNAVDLGKFGEYFTLILQSGVQDAMNLLTTKLAESGLFNFGQDDGKPGFWSRVGKTTLGVGAGLLGLWDEFGAIMGVPGARESSDKRFDQAESLFGQAGMADGILPRIAEAVAKGIEGAPNEFAERLRALREELLAASKPTQNTPANTPQNADTPLSFNTRKTPDLSDWEKLGLVIGGGGGISDYMRSTSENTRNTNTLLRRTNELLANNASRDTSLTGID